VRLLLIFIISIAWAQDWKVQKQNWNGVDVTWLEDEQFPTYQIIFYFAEGALSDHKIRSGETEALFDLLQSGTNSYTKDQIASSFEFYGVRVEPSVTHEYSTLEVRGMIQDMIPTTKLVCHLLNKTTFANKEVNLYTKKKKAFLGNLAAHPRELADRAFREISLAKTPLSRPSSGKLKALGNLSSSRLRDKLSLLNTKSIKEDLYSRTKAAA
jgi:zinc protease